MNNTVVDNYFMLTIFKLSNCFINNRTYAASFAGEVYSKARNYLYTNTRARIQSSPAAVGCLFPDELVVARGEHFLIIFLAKLR